VENAIAVVVAIAIAIAVVVRRQRLPERLILIRSCFYVELAPLLGTMSQEELGFRLSPGQIL